MGGIHGAEDLGGSLGAVPGVELPVAEAGDVEPGDVDVRAAVGDPLRDDPAQPAGREDADRVEPGAHEVAVDAGRLTDRRGEVGVKDSGPQKNVRMPTVSTTGTREMARSTNGPMRSQSG